MTPTLYTVLCLRLWVRVARDWLVRQGLEEHFADEDEEAFDEAKYDLARLLTRVRAEAAEAERERAAKVVDHQASVRRMRAQSFADDSDRADGEAQSDDIEREEAIAEALEYTAARIRQRAGKDGG